MSAGYDQPWESSMSAATIPWSVNRLLASMLEPQRQAILDRGYTVIHASGDRLHEAGGTVDEFAFPLSGMVSLTVNTREGRSVEIAVTGVEGMVGISRYLGLPTSDSNAVVQVAGEIFHVPAEVFEKALREDDKLRAAMARFVRSLMVEMAQSAVCNQLHSVEMRTARWLLHASDRSGTADLRLTHEHLAQILAVRRSSVTDVVGAFTRGGLTGSSRGLITITDATGMGKLVCECYDVVRAATPTYN